MARLIVHCPRIVPSQVVSIRHDIQSVPMAESTESALLSLLADMSRIHCIRISSPLQDPAWLAIDAWINYKNEHNTMTLLLNEACSATLAQLVGFLLQLLLSHPPFTHTSPDILPDHLSRFLVIWTRDFGGSLSTGNSPIGNHENRRLTPQYGLQLLVELRISFQNLTEGGFKFVSELLLSCICLLSPTEGGGSSGNWVNVHKRAVDVLSDLLYSVPAVGWLQQAENAKHTTAVWKCLQLLTSGAMWWGRGSKTFEGSLERLARRFCELAVINSGVVSRV